jgi:predicted outer membrane repeat protein/parallel beta-helix repeat protein
VDCVFQSNEGWQGGGVYCDGGSASIINCDFIGNLSANGGGLYLTNGSTALVSLCTFQGNEGIASYSGNTGGGIYCVGSSPTVQSCTFDQNGVSNNISAGAIYCGSSAINIDDCVFTGNVSKTSGGAIFCQGGATITGSTFTGNLSRGSNSSQGGGAIAFGYSPTTQATVSGNIIENNTAGISYMSEARGGGILCDNADPLIHDNVIRQNRAVAMNLAAGGGIYLCEWSNPTITNNTISENSVTIDHIMPEATSKGGAIYIEQNSNPLIGGSPTAANTFEDNTALVGADLAKDSDASVVDARFNTFEIYPISGYYVSPIDEFDVSGGTGLSPAVTHDVSVSPAGVDSSPESATQGPFLTIRAALKSVAPTATNPITVYVAPGIYSPAETGEVFPLPMFDHVSVVGAGLDRSIVDAEDTHRVFHCENVGTATIKGLTIRGGRAGSGGGVVCRSSSVQIECNSISLNTATLGAGIGCFDGSTLEIVNNVISDNEYLHSSYFGILGGGVLAFRDCDVFLGNNLIIRNTSESGGGLYCYDNSNAHVVNNTICDNDAQSVGGGICLSNASNATIENTVIWNNTAYTDPSIKVFSGCVAGVTYSDIQYGWAGATNINVYPEFDSNDRYYLLSSSPVIDAGNPDPSYNDPEDPLVPGSPLFPAMGGLRNDMGVYGGPGMKDLYDPITVAVAITGFFAEYADGTVRLKWTIGTADGLKGFRIYRSIESDQEFRSITHGLIGGADTREFVDTDVRPGLTYWYRLGAVDNDGEFYSAAVSVGIAAKNVALYQNHPNPFNPSTTISFYLPEAARTRLTVYNTAGQLVRNLVDELRSFGVHDVEWNGRDNNGHRVSSGVYFYRLTTGKRTLTKKTLLLK